MDALLTRPFLTSSDLAPLDPPQTFISDALLQRPRNLPKKNRRFFEQVAGNQMFIFELYHLAGLHRLARAAVEALARPQHRAVAQEDAVKLERQMLVAFRMDKLQTIGRGGGERRKLLRSLG